MSKETSLVVANYETVSAGLYARESALLAAQDCHQFDNWIGGFWQRWLLVHCEVLRIFLDHSLRSDQLAERYEKAAVELLGKRKRMVSSLAQGLRRSGRDQSVKNACARLVAEHDAVFSKIVRFEFEKLKVELSQAHVARKTLSAYARTVHYRGE